MVSGRLGRARGFGSIPPARPVHLPETLTEHVVGADGDREVAELVARVPGVEERAAEQELVGRLPPAQSPRPISVTDLVDPRRAFWRKTKGPAPMHPERLARLELGRRWHRRMADAVAEEGRPEVRLRRGGITGRIDLLTEFPVEIKTGVAPGGEPTPPVRPEHVEQLAFYCALAGSPQGRLVLLGLGPGGEAAVAANDLWFRDLALLDQLARERERALRAAVAAGDPSALPRCRWASLGCEFRDAGLCTCTGEEPEPPAEVPGFVERSAANDTVSERWRGALETIPKEEAPRLARFRDLLHPRRTYFRDLRGARPEGVPVRAEGAPLDAYELTVAALETGPLGELCRLVTSRDGPEEDLLAWRGQPVLLRSSRVRGRLSPEEIRSRFPQYVVDLGFRCALGDAPRGMAIVAFEHAGAPGESPLQVFSFDFTASASEFLELWRRRRDALAEVGRDRTPRELPPCPAWMARDCPYGAECGCAEDSARSQR